MQDVPAQAPGAELVHWADAAIGGALLFGVVDAVTAPRGGSWGFGAVVFLFALHLATAAPVLLLLAGAGRVASRLDRALGARSRPALAGVTALLLASPALSAAFHLRRAPRSAAFWIAVAGAAVVGVAAHAAGKRARSPGAWLSGALVAFALMSAVSTSMRLTGKLYRIEADYALTILLCGAAASIVCAWAIASLVAPTSGPGVAWKAASAVLGLALSRAAAMLGYLLSPTLKTAACIGAYIFLALGATMLSRRGALRHRLALLAPGVAAVAYLALALPLPSTIPWALATRTCFAAEILARTGLMRSSVTRYARALRERADLGPGSAVEAPPPAALPPPSAPLSILLVTADAFRYDRIGYSGGAPAGLTPRLDALAARAQRFHRAYPQAGWTSLSIPALLWSRYPKDLHFVPLLEDLALELHFERDVPRTAVINQRYQSPVEDPGVNAAEALGAQGFATIAVANDGGTSYFEPRLGFTRGFQRVVYPKHACPPAAELALANVPGLNDPCTVRLAAEEIAAASGRRFFLWVHLFGSHGPHRPYADEARFTGYDAQVHEVDRDIGALLDSLAALGRDRDTIVVFTGDHGEQLEQGRPLQGHHGLNLAEVSLRVPLLVAVPGLPARDVAAPEVGLVDVVPTLLRLAGVPVPGTMQGRDLAPLLGPGEVGEQRPVFIQTWRLEVDGTRKVDLIAAVHDGAKVILDLRSWTMAFYDVLADPGESRNLFAEATGPDRRRFDRLARLLVDWYELPR